MGARPEFREPEDFSQVAPETGGNAKHPPELKGSSEMPACSPDRKTTEQRW